MIEWQMAILQFLLHWLWCTFYCPLTWRLRKTCSKPWIYMLWCFSLLWFLRRIWTTTFFFSGCYLLRYLREALYLCLTLVYSSHIGFFEAPYCRTLICYNVTTKYYFLYSFFLCVTFEGEYISSCFLSSIPNSKSFRWLMSLGYPKNHMRIAQWICVNDI